MHLDSRMGRTCVTKSTRGVDGCAVSAATAVPDTAGAGGTAELSGAMDVTRAGLQPSSAATPAMTRRCLTAGTLLPGGATDKDATPILLVPEARMYHGTRSAINRRGQTMSEAAAKPGVARPLALLVAGEAEPPATERWIRNLRWTALAVFAGVPLLGFLAQPYAGRVVWTIVIAALPLFIVLVGYHRWRRICPLAFVSQIPVMLLRPGSRRAPEWLEANYPFVAFAVFFVSLWARLIATNGSGAAIAVFFILISLAALTAGSIYTGKTWCNYICPLSFIEKIYTEPHGLRETPNSQCTKCTACKKSCPDINEENGYWKDIDSRPKRFVYYAFPGLVF